MNRSHFVGCLVVVMLCACSGDDGSSSGRSDGGSEGGSIVGSDAAVRDGAPVDGTLTLLDADVADVADAAPDMAPPYIPCDTDDADPVLVFGTRTSSTFPKIDDFVLFSRVFLDSLGDPFVVALGQTIMAETPESTRTLEYFASLARLKRVAGTCTWSEPIRIDDLPRELAEYASYNITFAGDYDATSDTLLLAAAVRTASGLAYTTQLFSVAHHLDTSTDLPNVNIHDFAEYVVLSQIKNDNGSFHAALIQNGEFCTGTYPDNVCDRVQYGRFDVAADLTITYVASPESEEHLAPAAEDGSALYNQQVAVAMDSEHHPIFAWIETHQIPDVGGTLHHSYLLLSRYDTTMDMRTTHIVRELELADAESLPIYEASLDVFQRESDGAAIIVSTLSENGVTGHPNIVFDTSPADGSTSSSAPYIIEPAGSVFLVPSLSDEIRFVASRSVLGSTITSGSGDGPLLYHLAGSALMVTGFLSDADDMPTLTGQQVSAVASPGLRLWGLFGLEGDDAMHTGMTNGLYVWRER